MRKLLLSLILLPNLAIAQYTGFSAYAGMNKKFPCGRFIEVSRYADKPIMAVLYGTFGNSTHCLRSFMSKFEQRPHAVEIHLNNETCRRGGRTCYEQEILASLSPRDYSHALQKMPNSLRLRLEKRLNRIIEITKWGNSNTRFLLSLGLEDQYTPEAANSLFNVVRKVWPYEVIRNPAADKSSDKNADVIELHSAKSIFTPDQTCIWNQDGLDGGIKEATKFFDKYRDCLARLAWTKEGQGIKETFIPPLKRTFVITKKQVRDYGRLFRSANTSN